MISKNTDSPLRIGQIGIGGYGQRHLMTLRSLAGSGICHLAAIADPFASQHPDSVSALLAEGVDIYDDYKEIVARDDIDAVVIATPISLHFPQVMDCLQAGKHVYVEKPPCVSLEEYDALEKAREAVSKTCAVGFQLQTTPAMRYLKSQLVQGAIGDLQTVWSSIGWRRGDRYYSRAQWAGKWEHKGAPVFDGPATNALSHVVHASLFLAGSDEAQWADIDKVRGHLRKARPMESYDCIALEALTKTGVSVRLAFAHATALHDEAIVHCIGTHGRATIHWNGTVLLTREGQREQELEFRCEPHFTAMLDFVKAAQTGCEPTSSLVDCLAYGRAVNGALQSSGGAQHFESELVSRHDDGEDECYIVSGLDDQMAVFARDHQALPALLSLSEKPWVATTELSPSLPVPEAV